MKRQIDLQKAGEAEAFGALALRGRCCHRNGGTDVGAFTPAQRRAFSELAKALIDVARAAGAVEAPVTIGDMSIKLSEKDGSSTLSIRTSVAR